jgi:hypothetical protein
MSVAMRHRANRIGSRLKTAHDVEGSRLHLSAVADLNGSRTQNS